MRAVVVEKGHPASLREVGPGPDGDGLDPGQVVVDVLWSGLNYKDGLALAGDPGVARVSPLVPGIDLVGTIAAVGPVSSGASSSASASPASPASFAVGDLVVATGAGLGETRDGGYAERAVVDTATLVAVPDGIDARRAAAIGTAGLTAMLSVLRLERDVRPGDGEIVVTGAAGGVGSVAVAVLSRLGYSVTASSGRADELGPYLRSLGASSVIDRAELGEQGKPLRRPRWAGAVDSVGSTTLASVLAETAWGGTVTACGLAQGSDLTTTVLPFILRSVTLAGIDSVQAPLALRQEAWSRLATDLDLELLDSLTTETTLDEVVALGPEIVAGRVRGRTVVRVGA
ncbi:acryloyl-CoA reductase [Frigoribacterium sp. CFBP9039]|uniref:acrylyl-CoA reductase family protein n=1 Tax=unclassified Frigoribacterium TaxID=2627005 RepID=UPI00177D03FB|nr:MULTISPECIES: acryloyl-CoA reductase [unclassified Frigoribacterium]MBD8704297.1 acryloyl-CoA reductase [Frigoribacterium sp. CFBP 13712]MDY0945852.1 acryloyl-CoA reductase [Frigoribacterium sp. CFBP9039]